MTWLHFYDVFFSLTLTLNRPGREILHMKVHNVPLHLELVTLRVALGFYDVDFECAFSTEK